MVARREGREAQTRAHQLQVELAAPVAAGRATTQRKGQLDEELAEIDAQL